MHNDLGRIDPKFNIGFDFLGGALALPGIVASKGLEIAGKGTRAVKNLTVAGVTGAANLTFKGVTGTAKLTLAAIQNIFNTSMFMLVNILTLFHHYHSQQNAKTIKNLEKEAKAADYAHNQLHDAQVQIMDALEAESKAYKEESEALRAELTEIQAKAAEFEAYILSEIPKVFGEVDNLEAQVAEKAELIKKLAELALDLDEKKGYFQKLDPEQDELLIQAEEILGR